MSFHQGHIGEYEADMTLDDDDDDDEGCFWNGELPNSVCGCFTWGYYLCKVPC